MASLAQKFPGLVACRCMSYLQQGAPAVPLAPSPGPGPSQTLPMEALPSTHADVPPSAGPEAGAAAAGLAAAVPRITFLYKLVPGVADRSFGAHAPARGALSRSHKEAGSCLSDFPGSP